jgi:iron-sulfur cluster repair protein YtfE (RIC family)
VSQSQDLIEHIIQAHNQLARTKYELDRIQQVAKLLVNVHEDLEKDLGYAQLFK